MNKWEGEEEALFMMFSRIGRKPSIICHHFYFQGFARKTLIRYWSGGHV